MYIVQLAQERPRLMPQIPWWAMDWRLPKQNLHVTTSTIIIICSHEYLTLSSLHCYGGRRRRRRIKRGSAASAPPSLAPVLDKKPSTGLSERKIGFSKILTFADVVLQYDHCTRFVATFRNPKGSFSASQSFFLQSK